MRNKSLCVLVLAAGVLSTDCNRKPAAPVPPTPAPDPTAVPSAIRFEDVTTSSGVAFVHQNGAAGKKWMPETMGSGVAAFDADGDGRLDLLFVNGRFWDGDPRAAGGQPTLAFYRNVTEPGGPIKLVDATKDSGLNVSLYGMGAAVADLDGDGATDLLVTGLSGNRLFANDGKGRFRDVTKGSGLEGKGWATSAAFSDLDGDGILDLFLCQYVDWTSETDLFCTLDGTSKSYCTPERYPGRASRLFKGLGGHVFREITKQAGVENKDGKALGVAVRDIDGDGRPDLAVANDTSPNNLYRNVKTVDGVPIFTDIAIEAGVAVGEDGKARGAMGIAFGDTKNEGGTSLVIGNFSNEMWSVFSAGKDGDSFVDEAVLSGIGRTSLLPLTFAVAFADFDLDGRLDLVGANGHVETSVQAVQQNVTYEQPTLLYRGLGAGRFSDVSRQAGESFAAPLVGRGLAVADLDGDSLPDLVITQNGRAAKVFRNAGKPAPSVTLDLRGRKPAGAAIGARVTSQVLSVQRVDEVSGGDGYLSAGERVVRIGLGTAPKVERVEVRWRDGSTAEARDLAPGRYLWRQGEAPVAQAPAAQAR